MAFVLVPVVAYLVGGIPFGYLVARLKGVDLFKAGSGNIGATNVGRVLGRKYGILVFVLDFLKGAVPVALAVPLATAVEVVDPGLLDVLRVEAAAAAFLGHLFPIYLRFRGGKGVATGAGAVAVLVPGPAAVAIGVWAVVALASRTVSLASIVAVIVLSVYRVMSTGYNFDVVTGFCLFGTLLITLKHRANVGRLLAGNENTLKDGPMRHRLLRAVHVLAVGFWFGGAGFFNFGVALTQNKAIPEAVNTAPNDRTLGFPLLPPDQMHRRADLGNALFGAAVGPVFPKYFAMQAACGTAAFVTALAWWRLGGVHRWRGIVLGVALLTVVVGWPVSDHVTRLRIERLTGDPAAVAAFRVWHFVSLGVSLVTIGLAGVGTALAGFLPDRREAA